MSPTLAFSQTHLRGGFHVDGIDTLIFHVEESKLFKHAVVAQVR